MARYYPERASRTETDGSVRLHCTVAANGSLTACSVTSENPADMGFAEAAIRLSRSFRMRPRTSDGTPVGGAEVNIPITFRYPRT